MSVQSLTDQINLVRTLVQLPRRRIWSRLRDELNPLRSGALLLVLLLTIVGAVLNLRGEAELASSLLLISLLSTVVIVLWQGGVLLFSDRASDFSHLLTEAGRVEMPLVQSLLAVDAAGLEYVHQEYVDRIALIEGTTTLLVGPLRTTGMLAILAAAAGGVLTLTGSMKSDAWWSPLVWGIPVGIVGAGLMIDDALNGLRKRRDLLSRVIALRAAVP